jgi:hypothetical protein
MDYAIRYVNDLPEGHDFVLIQTADAVLVAIRASAVHPCVLEDAWAAYRALLAPPTREPVSGVHVLEWAV